jgi:hypothetical protein
MDHDPIDHNVLLSVRESGQDGVGGPDVCSGRGPTSLSSGRFRFAAKFRADVPFRTNRLTSVMRIEAKD